MKLAISLLLSVLSLTYSTISMAESTVSSADKDKALVEACLKDPFARVYGYYFVPNEQQRPHFFEEEKKTQNLEGYKVFNYMNTIRSTRAMTESEILKNDIESTKRVADCLKNELYESVFSDEDVKLSNEQYKNKEKEAEKLADSYTVSENNILNKTNKIQFNFSTNFIKEKSREEICEDLKGKFETNGTDRYAFCMGTQTHQGPTCQNNHGDPCGTKSEKSRAGSTVVEEKHYLPK